MNADKEALESQVPLQDEMAGEETRKSLQSRSDNTIRVPWERSFKQKPVFLPMVKHFCPKRRSHCKKTSSGEISGINDDLHRLLNPIGSTRMNFLGARFSTCTRLHAESSKESFRWLKDYLRRNVFPMQTERQIAYLICAFFKINDEWRTIGLHDLLSSDYLKFVRPRLRKGH